MTMESYGEVVSSKPSGQICAYNPGEKKGDGERESQRPTNRIGGPLGMKFSSEP